MKRILPIGLLFSICLLASTNLWAQISGVTFYPEGATADDSVTIYVNTNFTCPTRSADAVGSLNGSSIVRLYAGINIKTGTNTAIWQNVVGTSGSTLALTTFNSLGNGIFSKKILPRSYFGATTRPSTDTLVGINFVLNGGPDVSVWDRQGKVCAANGAASIGSAGDFTINFPISRTNARIRASWAVPSADSIVNAGSTIGLRALAFDTTGQAINRIVYWVNGVKYDSSSVFPYTVNYTMGISGSISVQAQVVGVYGTSVLSSIKTLNILPAPRLGITSASPAIGSTTVMGLLQSQDVSVEPIDTSGRAINSVSLFVDGAIFGTVTVPPYRFAYGSSYFNDTVTAYYIVNAQGGATYRSGDFTIISRGTSSNLGSGVTIIPASATADSTITFVVNTGQTCSLVSTNLVGATTVRIHSGVQIGLRGGGFQNIVSAGPGSTQTSTEFTNRGNGIWTKTFVPRAYYGLAATDSIYALNFVFNGGLDADPWTRQAKVCGTGADFRYGLDVPLTSPRLSSVIELPSVDTAIGVNSTITVRVSASDTTGQPIRKVILWVNGVKKDSITTAPNRFAFTAPANNQTVTLQAQVLGVRGFSKLSNIRTLNIVGGLVPARLSASVVSPANGLVTKAGKLLPISISATDTAGQALTKVILWVDGRKVDSSATAPYNFSYFMAPAADTFLLQAQVFSVTGESYVSAVTTVYANGSFANLGSGIVISPANATVDSAVTVYLNAAQTCPAGELVNSLKVRIHSGVEKTSGGPGFQNTISAASGAIQDSTRLTKITSTYWSKTFVPRAYYGLGATEKAYALNFVFNGGLDATPWDKTAKVCGTLGDFRFPLIVPILYSPVSVAITSPANNSSIRGGSRLSIAVSAVDSSTAPVQRVVLYVNGLKVDSSSTAPYNFNYSLPYSASRFVLKAQVVSNTDYRRFSDSVVVNSTGTFANLGSGVIISPANASADSTITVYVNTSQTCPSITASSSTSLGIDNMVRIHSGVQIGLRGATFQRVVDATGATIDSTSFINTGNKVWTKTFVPRRYYGLATTDSVYAIDFVLNGGPVGTPFSREGKVCGANGQAGVGAAGNFRFALNVPITPARINARISQPSADTGITVGNTIRIVASASDSTGQAIRKIVLWANGVKVDSSATSSVQYLYTAPQNNDTVDFQAQVYGAGGVVVTTPVRTVIVSGAFVAPRLAVRVSSPIDGIVQAAGTVLPISVSATDSSGRAISKVILWVDGAKVDSIAFAPYNFSYFLAPIIDTITIAAQAFNSDGNSLVSSNVTFRTTGSFANLGSGIIISPANATADSTITVYMNATQTCPAGDLNNSTKVRIHAGVQKGLNGGAFQNTVSAGVGATQSSTELTKRRNGYWTKTFTPRTYFGLAATDSIYAMNFVFNGGPNASPWDKSAKVCGTLGDFRFGLNVPLTTPRLSANILTPSADTTVRVGTLVSVKVSALDSSGQAIRKVVLWVNGAKVDSLTNAPFNFGYTAPNVNGTYALVAQVYGVRGSVVLSSARNITVEGQIFPPRLFARVLTADTTVGINRSLVINYEAGDSIAGQSVIGVRLLVNGITVQFSNDDSGSFVLNTLTVPDTAIISVEVLGQLTATLRSSSIRVITQGVVQDLGSGVVISPANASADSLITITVYPTLTCPTSSANNPQSLANATIVRIHSGVQIGLNGTAYQRAVDAIGSTISLTEFTSQPNGTWTKSFVPRTYYGLAVTDSVYAMNFVLNGGPSNSPWNRQGKVCGTNGQPAAGAAGDFRFGLNVPLTAPRLSVSILTPTVDTTVAVNTPIQVRVSAMDSTNQPIRKVVLWSNGVRVDSITSAPYNFVYTTPNVNGTYALVAQVIGARGTVALSSARNITTEGQIFPPRLYARILSPTTDAIAGINSSIVINYEAGDSISGQSVIGVRLLVNGVTVQFSNNDSGSFVLNTLSVPDTALISIEVLGQLTATLRSSSVRVITQGFVQDLGSGVVISPANASADSLITITVYPTRTCPTSSANNSQSLANATMVRIHSGVQIGLRGNAYQRTVNAQGATIGITEFRSQPNGTWTKSFVPRTYYGLAASDSVYAMNFVLNGGFDFTPFDRVGKVCGTNGQAANGTAGDFRLALNVPITLPRLAVAITNPSADTSVQVGTSVNVNVNATDTSGLPIRKVILWADGVKIDSVTSAPYQFNYIASTVVDTVLLNAQVIGANGSNVISASRTIWTVGALVPARLAVNITSPTSDTSVVAGSIVPFSVVATDSSNQAITSVEILADGAVISTLTSAPYTYNYTSVNRNTSIAITARVNSVTGSSLSSSPIVVNTVGSITNLGSGITVSPANATADDTVTITVNVAGTCSPAGSTNLVGATTVRLHSGVQIGLNGGAFQRQVGAGPTDTTQYRTGFTSLGGGIWVKKIVPRTYFRLSATDSVYAMTFVLNGGANATPWTRQAKVCGTGADFRYGMFVPLTAPRLSASIVIPTSDTTVQINSTTTIVVNAIDSTTQAIRKVILWANGSKIDSLNAAPYRFAYRAPSTNGSVTLLAQAIGVRGFSIISAPRILTVNGQLPPPQLSVVFSGLSADTAVSLGRTLTLTTTATDTTGQAIRRVQYFVDGILIGTDSIAPYTLNWNAPALPDTVQLTAVVTSVTGATRTSSPVTIRATGTYTSLGSGVYIVPARPSANEVVTVVVNTAFTCPTVVASATGSLYGSTQVRLHAGVKIGANGTNFQRTVSAIGATIDSTNFTRQYNGTWVKTILPRTYFGLGANDTAYALNFVLNGGPRLTPWDRQGKVCGNNGLPNPDPNGDFNFNLRVDVTTPRLSVSIVSPSSDTVVDSLSVVPIRVMAMDSSGLAIRKVVLLANGRAIDSLTTAPYNFTWTAPNRRDTVVFTAKVVSTGRGSLLSAGRTIRVRKVLSVAGLLADEIQIAPNPATDFINVQSKEAEIIKLVVLTLQGKTVVEEVVNGTSAKVNMSNLPTGAYLMRIETNKGFMYSRVVKQ